MIWTVAETQTLPPILAIATFITQQIQPITYTRHVVWFSIGKIYLIGLLYSISR